MRFLKIFSGLLAAMMFMLSAVSGLSYADGTITTSGGTSSDETSGIPTSGYVSDAPVSSDIPVSSDVQVSSDTGEPDTDSIIDEETGLMFTLLEDNTYSISCPEFNGYWLSGELVIPSEYNGKSVTSIADDAFFNCDGITSVTIPQSITNIGINAFGDCNNLTTITIPQSVTNIGGGAFEGCSLTTITIPQSVTNIGLCAFSCGSLTAINVDENNEYYYSEDGVLFTKNKTELISYPIAKKIETLVVPESVTKIGDFAFYYHDELVSVDLHDGITTIGSFSFCDCESLASLIIPSSVTKIDESAFRDCESLTSMVIPDGIVCIEKLTFNGCSGLKSVTIPMSVEKIGWGAFIWTSVEDVYYEGTESQWNKIEIEDSNEVLKNAAIHYKFTEPDATNSDDSGKPNTSEPTSEPVTNDPTESDTSDSTTSKPDDINSDASIENTSNPTSSDNTISSSTPTNGDVSQGVTRGENVPKAEIKTPGGSLAEAVLTAAELEQYKNGADIRVSLEVNAAESSVSESDKQLVERTLSKLGYKSGKYLDLRLFKTLENGTKEQITETNAPITISFEIPEALQGAGREYVVVRVHNGEADVLKDYDDNANTITIRTDKFSVYVLAYLESAASVGNSQTGINNPYTGSGSPTTIYLTVGIVSLIVFVLLCLFTGKNGMTVEQKERKFAKLITWGKRGGRVRAAVALIIIFLLLSFYYGIGMKTSEN